MRALFLLVAVMTVASDAERSALLHAIGQTALSQSHRMDVKWEPSQRDCAGLIRFAYRQAYAQHAPRKVKEGLWLDEKGQPSAFATAEVLLRQSFVPLGRDDGVKASLQTGDILAFRQQASGVDVFAAPYHLIMVVRPTGADRHQLLVVYHTGNAQDGVRAGSMRAFERDAPKEWLPDDKNPSFLGYYRYKELIP